MIRLSSEQRHIVERNLHLSLPGKSIKEGTAMSKAINFNYSDLPSGILQPVVYSLYKCCLKKIQYAAIVIIEPEQLPEGWKEKFEYYEKDKHFLIYCSPCNVYKMIPEI